FIGVPEVLGGHHWLAEFLSPVFAVSTYRAEQIVPDHTTEYILMIVSVACAAIAVVVAYLKYVKNNHIPAPDEADRSTFAKLSFNKFYVDEIYSAMISKPLDALSQFFFKVVDKSGIDGLVNGLGKTTFASGRGLRLLQSGNVGFYIFMMVIGIIAILFYGFYNV
ncbi:MAG TPA: NADH-quinone oxidoreductase subunit L, partial [Sphingobacteriaceae bacterium]|nr:NADH-quinone oxidoreductase subunit L [Sphingobacteriaceae bacterium]